MRPRRAPIAGSRKSPRPVELVFVLLADGLCNGGVEHVVRRNPRRERPKVRRQRRLCQSAVAVVQHRGPGERVYRRSAGRAAVAGYGLACRRGDHRRRPARRRLCRLVSDQRTQEPHRPAGNEEDLRQPAGRLHRQRALVRRRFSLSLLPEPGVRHPALLSYDRQSQILSGIHRHPRFDQFCRMDRRRIAVPKVSQGDHGKGAAEFEHPVRHPDDGGVPVAVG